MIIPAPRLVLALLILLVALLPLPIARADGVYIPQRAYPTLPTIPMQSAVIIQHDGAETLIVESGFQSQSPEVAWIVPLPAAPTKLQLTEPGAISSTAYSLRPEIKHDLHGLIGLSFGLFLAILPLALTAIFTRNNAVLRMSILVEIFIIVHLIGILLPSLGTAGNATTDMPGLSVLSTQRLGDADFTVLDVAAPDVLDQWLAAQGMRPLDAAAQPIVTDYIARHWVFVVGTLHNTTQQLTLPRPLMATFPTTQPVFPMKLTALANTTTHVELCVFADEEAAATGFHCVIADQFERHPAEPDREYGISNSMYYSSMDTTAALGHPDIVPQLWNNCTATKLTADLPPSQMDHDIAIQLQPLTPHRDTFYTSLARRQIALTFFSAGTTFFLILAAILLRGRRRPTSGQSKLLLISFFSVCLIAAGTWLFLPTTPIHIVPRLARYQPFNLSQAALELAPDGLIRKDMTPDQIAALPQLMVDRAIVKSNILTNPYTGEPIRRECSPGNFALRTIKGKLYFCTYNEDGIEGRTLLP